MDSKLYWENRYFHGGNSGAGSRGHLAEWKAQTINAFVKAYDINKVVEFGCGDGEQSSLYNIAIYTGVDISRTVLNKCRNRFINYYKWNFIESVCIGTYVNLTLSIDVIYHLLEDDIYNNYMNELFDTSKKYVIIYSTNDENLHNTAEHIKHRNFTKWVSENKKDFKLLSVIKNKYPYNGDTTTSSSCDFYIYEKQ